MLKWIKDYCWHDPNISVCELYGKLREDKADSRHPGSLYRVFIRLGLRKKPESTKKKSRHLGKYDTPEKLGKKWQMDVKYVPSACYAGKDGKKLIQYTMTDEASRERSIFPYKEQSGFSTVDFIKRAITCFGYCPKMIQTDNGAEFTNFSRTKRVHIFDKFCLENGIQHKLIRPHPVAQRQGRAQSPQRHCFLLFFSLTEPFCEQTSRQFSLFRRLVFCILLVNFLYFA